MMIRSEALALIAAHLGKTAIARHSIFVGDLMGGLAGGCGEDPALWRLTGYCHDLDMMAVNGSMHLHGPTAAAWLQGQLPMDALEAIAAHDHRAGRKAETALARGLRLADALAVLDLALGRAVLSDLAEMTAVDLVVRSLPAKPWLGTMIDELAASLGLSRAFIVDCLAGLPHQKEA